MLKSIQLDNTLQAPRDGKFFLKIEMIWSLNTNILILILTFDGIKHFHTKKK